MSGMGLSLVDQMRSRMQWLQSRQKVLAENVSNSDLPQFKPKDLRPMSSGGVEQVAVARTSAAHIGGAGGDGLISERGAKKFETMPSGNAVSLEDEMQKLADTQLDYQTVTSLYSKSLSLLKTAVGKR